MQLLTEAGVELHHLIRTWESGPRVADTICGS